MSNVIREARYMDDLSFTPVRRGMILRYAVGGKLRQGQLAVVRFEDGDTGLRRYFRFKGADLWLTEELDCESPVQRRVVAWAPVVGFRSDRRTSKLRSDQFPVRNQSDFDRLDRMAIERITQFLPRIHALQTTPAVPYAPSRN